MTFETIVALIVSARSGNAFARAQVIELNRAMGPDNTAHTQTMLRAYKAADATEEYARRTA